MHPFVPALLILSLASRPLFSFRSASLQYSSVKSVDYLIPACFFKSASHYEGAEHDGEREATVKKIARVLLVQYVNRPDTETRTSVLAPEMKEKEEIPPIGEQQI